jgi:hypothetical protein
MRKMNALVMRSTTCYTDLTLKDEFGSGSGLKAKLKEMNLEINDRVVIVPSVEFELLEERVEYLEKECERLKAKFILRAGE